MQNVVVNGLNNAVTEYPMKLNNGDLLIWMDINSKVKEAYVITSFRNNKGKSGWEQTANYCSFINLDTGAISFEEPCSRNTSNIRILKHLNRVGGDCYPSTFRNLAGEQLKLFRKGNYRMSIDTMQEEKGM